MLVLSRRVKDTIRFPEFDITIEILRVKGASTRIGIDAPVEIQVLRGELETCLLYTSPSPRDKRQSRMPSSA